MNLIVLCHVHHIAWLSTSDMIFAFGASAEVGLYHYAYIMLSI